MILTGDEILTKYKQSRESVLYNKYIHQRASGQVYQCYRINSFELDLLCSLCAHLSQFGKQIGSKNIFFDSLTGNSRRKAKFEGYLSGLINKGFVNRYELRSQPGSLSLGVTPLGWDAVNRYLNYLEGLLLRYGTPKKFIHEIILPDPAFEPIRYRLLTA